MSTPTSIDELAILRAMHKAGPPVTIAGIVNVTGMTEDRAGDALEALLVGGLILPDTGRGWWSFTPHGKSVAASLAERPRKPAFHVVLHAAAMHADALRTAGKSDDANEIVKAVGLIHALREAAEATVVERS